MSEAKCKSNLKQQPMHLGDQSRVLFGTANASAGSANFSANVIEISNDTIKLSKVFVNGIRVGDKFRIYDPFRSFSGFLPPNATAVVEVVASRVDELQSMATLIREYAGTLQDVKTGWIARLYDRRRATVVNLVLPEAGIEPTMSTLVERLKKDCQSHANAYMLIIIQEGSKAALTLELNEQGLVQFRDGDGNHMPHEPTPPLTAPSGPRQMISLLQHLCFYQLVAGIKSPGESAGPRYEFEILQDKIQEDDTESLAAWRIRFKNLHDMPLYITILNLGPAYGIHQIYPDDASSSGAVDPKEEIPYLVINMHVPKLLKADSRAPTFEMRDTIKIFITMEQASFSHYCLPDLKNFDELDFSELGAQMKRRNGTLLEPQLESWAVDEKVIVTAIESKI